MTDTSSLAVQVVRFAGFRRIWEKRYCLITPRRHNLRMHPNDSATYMLLTWFRSPTDFTVLGKVQLDPPVVISVSLGYQSKPVALQTFTRILSGRHSALSCHTSA